MTSTARSARAAGSVRTVVSSTNGSRATELSSNPTTDTSSGTRTPARTRVAIPLPKLGTGPFRRLIGLISIIRIAIGVSMTQQLTASTRSSMTAIGAVALVFVVTQVPETRGITLEKLEEDVSTGAIHTITPTTRTVRRWRR